MVSEEHGNKKHNGPKSVMAAYRKGNREADREIYGDGFKSNKKVHNPINNRSERRKNKINNNNLDKYIDESINKVINEISIDKKAAAYKKAMDKAHNLVATSPMQSDKYRKQALRFKQNVAKDYNQTYGTAQNQMYHGVMPSDINYEPSSKSAYVTTTTDPTGKDTRKLTYSNNGEVPSVAGRYFPALDMTDLAAKRAARGEKKIQSLLDKLNTNESKLSLDELVDIISESVYKQIKKKIENKKT